MRWIGVFLIVLGLAFSIFLSRSWIEHAKQKPSAPFEILARIEPNITIDKKQFNDLMLKIEGQFPRRYLTYSSKIALLNEIINVELLYKEAVNCKFKFTDSDKRHIADAFLRVNLEQRFRPVSAEEALAFYAAHQHQYDSIRASHILIKVNENATNGEKEMARTKITQILNQLEKNTSQFAELAKTHSNDSSAKNGGDLGWFLYSTMVEPFSKAAFSLSRKGEFTHVPVKTPFGYHLILLTDERRGFKIYHQQILDQLTIDRKRTIVSKFIDAVRKRYSFVIYDDNVRLNYPPPWPSEKEMKKMEEYYQQDLDQARAIQ